MKRNIILCLVVIMLTAFSSCSSNSTNKEEKTDMNDKLTVQNIPDPFIDYDNGLMEQMDKNGGYLKFTAFDEFKDFVNNNNIDNYYLKKFSEDYFKDNTLFITFKFTSSSIKHDIEEPIINDSEIIINIKETIPTGKMTMDLKFRGYFISINKEYLKNKKVDIIYTKKDTK
ncbi:hypothetical protein [Anaerofustis stercorihominis]|uniref:hypothetical protein n=1 Tax=Anaerofustis stercorihominis TaxID=214853 RepID=UPI00214B9866|nr:hypothetical protein [Anaerofustis stercorihominis]MCR2033111.1 hypothetical protein [Anaerofustis stercorihominis]